MTRRSKLCERARSLHNLSIQKEPDLFGKVVQDTTAMPLLCCGSSSVQVDKLGTRPGSKPEEDANNNKGEVIHKAPCQGRGNPESIDPMGFFFFSVALLPL